MKVICIFTKKELTHPRVRRVKLTSSENKIYETLVEFGFDHQVAVQKVLDDRAERLEKLLK